MIWGVATEPITAPVSEFIILVFSRKSLTNSSRPFDHFKDRTLHEGVGKTEGNNTMVIGLPG
jgi:hypothetical protein